AVDAARTAALLVGHHHEGRYIGTDQAAHADEGVRTDLAELVHARIAGHDHPVADLDVPGQGRIIGKDGVVADDAVVRDVHVGQKPVVVADARDAATAFSAPVHRDEIPKHVVVADFQARRLTGVFLVL